LRGKKLEAPKGFDTRPTTDRVRENLFNILSHKIDLDGLRVLDLFAGSGALGFEALSRGASFALFVEEATKARMTIRQNAENLGLTGNVKIYRRDAAKPGTPGSMSPFDLVFADPPYGKGLGAKAAASLVQGGWLTGNAIFILEEDRSEIPEKLTNFNTLNIRTYGDTAIGLFEYAE